MCSISCANGWAAKRIPMRKPLVLLLTVVMIPAVIAGQNPERPRARDMGVAPGVFAPGPLNSITDVPGVRVGHSTLIAGESVRTGVTAIVPHGGNIFREKVPAAIIVGNGFGKLIGMTQVRELGQLETPILLTNTLAVWDAADALVTHMLALPGNEDVRSINPVVGETNDGWLNDIRGRPLQQEHFDAALRKASGDFVPEGSVGAGTGTRAFGFKGGIGSSSRRLPARYGGFNLGILVQSNFGGVLSIGGAPVGKELGHLPFRASSESSGDGSCMIVVATDAPLNARQLERLARRALAGMARTGSSFSNGSGDYVIAFSTRRVSDSSRPRLEESQLSPLFQATIEATEEAIYNSILRATTITGRDEHTAEAIPIDDVRVILQRYGVGVAPENK